MKRFVLILLAVCITLGAALFLNRPDGRVQVIFLDVGQGSAVLVQQGSTQILIDGGPSPQAVLGEIGRLMPYWDRNIELVVLTHAHQDHLAGLVEVLKRYRANAVLQTGIPNETALYSEWQKLLVSKKPRLITAVPGLELQLDGIGLSVLNPPAVPPKGADLDVSSLVLKVRAGTVEFLLASDIGRESELDLLYRRLVPDCSVLQLAHHGSSASTSRQFLDVARPELAVISVGENNFGHPGEDVLERLSATPVYRTDLNGTVEFITDGAKLWVKTGR